MRASGTRVNTCPARRYQMNRIVLVVENDDDLRDAMLTALSYAGFRALGARSARQALCFLEDVSPCVIVIDFLLADMNGVELATAIRTRSSLELTPLLMTTGASVAARTELSRARIAVQVLEKPVDSETFTQTIEDLWRMNNAVDRAADAGNDNAQIVTDDQRADQLTERLSSRASPSR